MEAIEEPSLESNCSPKPGANPGPAVLKNELAKRSDIHAGGGTSGCAGLRVPNRMPSAMAAYSLAVFIAQEAESLLWRLNKTLTTTT